MIMPCNRHYLPSGVEIESKQIIGPRVPVKNRRAASQTSDITAEWPEAGLSTKRDALLIFIVSGQLQMQIGEQLVRSPAGFLYFIPPGLPHPDGSNLSMNGTGSVLWMRRCGRGMRCWISHWHDNSNWRSRPGETFYFPGDPVVSPFDVMCNQLAAKAKSDIFWHALMLFLLLMQQELEHKRAFNVATNRFQRERENWNHFAGNDPMEIAQSYIQSHLGDALTIEKVAHVLHMSRASFAKQFRHYTGQTFLEFLQHHRIEQARTFLTETDWTVSTISELSGFASGPSFNTFFVKHCGITPAQYRLRERARLRRQNSIEKNDTHK